MQYAGHTMGVPSLNLQGAMSLFSELGFDGVEIRCAKDGQLDTETVDQAYLELIKQWSDDLELAISCLTSYYRDFVTERRDSEILALKRVVQIAYELRCPLIRLYGGTEPSPRGYSLSETWDRTVSGIRELADYAEARGICCCIETHVGSLSYSIEDSVRMVREVDRKNVGLLLDFAWVYMAGATDARSVIDLCKPYLLHCHYKDWRITSREGHVVREARLMGEGDLPWKDVLMALRESGYDATMTDEYEKYWHPDRLPDAREGMKKNLEFVRSIIDS